MIADYQQKGEHIMADLKIFTENIEHEALNQIYTLVKQPAFSDCKIRIMPDVHAGAGCVIGFTADLGEKVIPNIVGVHNYIEHDTNIVRKGAISAKMGEKVLIPINMRDGCILGIGKGNEDWNYSAPHGAGRTMSRTKAKESILLEEYQKAMDGIFTTSVNTSTIDESPMAYKTMDEIIGNIKDTVEIVDIIKPIYNFKANE